MLIPKKNARILPFSDRKSPIFLGCLIASCALTPVVNAADNPSAHEHGRAELQMALENAQIELLFTSPAYNLAGFEHQARTEDEKKWLADIRHWLEKTPLINSETGVCQVSAASVQLGGKSGAHHAHENHKKSHDDDEATHRDYEVTQQLNCEGIKRENALTSPLLQRFTELEEITIEWVGPSGQGSALVTASGQSFRLSE